MSKIKGVIFDWAGTTVDYGCFAPVEAFKESFALVGINLTYDEIRAPMGMMKIEHIEAILNMPRVRQLFHDIHGRYHDEIDVKTVYTIFEQKLFDCLENHTLLKPYVLETVDYLRSNGIKIGSTTGYTDLMMQVVIENANRQGYYPDSYISPDDTNFVGRPYPDMIYKNMEYLKLSDPTEIIKVGDTLSDIMEGKNAGVISIGVLEGSSLVGLNADEYESLMEEERNAVLEKAKLEYKNAGADYVILNLDELPQLITQLG